MPPRGLKGYTVMALQLSELKLITASNIIALRTQAGLTQAELGGKLNYSDKTISKWERGVTYPDITMIPDICTQLGVSEQTARQDACKIEHDISPETFEAIRAQVRT